MARPACRLADATCFSDTGKCAVHVRLDWNNPEFGGISHVRRTNNSLD